MTYWLLVFSNPTQGREHDYNKWYDNQHLPDLLRIPGVVSARRLVASDTQFAKDDKLPGKYLALYEIEAEDLAAVFLDMQSRVGESGMVMSDAIDLASIRTMVFYPHTPSLPSE